MNINLIKLKGVERAINALVVEVRRLADLKELELQHVHGLTTRANVTATKQQLDDTVVAYTDPRVSEMLTDFERRAGRALTDDEVAKVMSAAANILDDDE